MSQVRLSNLHHIFVHEDFFPKYLLLISPKERMISNECCENYHLLIFSFWKNSFNNTNKVSNSLDPDHAQCLVGPHYLPKNCLTITCFHFNSSESPGSHDNCCLLFHLLMYLGSLYWKQYRPRPYLIPVCFHVKISLACI